MLERCIFPAVYADPGIHTVLFAGVAPYTSWYPGAFRLRPRLAFCTIDADPDAARWGARGRHRIARLESLADEPESHCAYDLVIANGLFGFGTDTREGATAVVDVCDTLLRPGGRLLLGYSKPGAFDPEAVDATRFQPAPIPGLDADRHTTANVNRHTFVCFRKVRRAP